MQIQEATALGWLTDEVQQTLQSVDERLASIRSESAAQYAATLSTIRADIDSFAGAFDLAGCDALSRYSQALVSALDAWRAQPSLMTDEVQSHFRLACQHLHHFLRLKQRDAEFCEWVLYLDYRWLCEITNQTAHPVQLWSSDQRNASHRHLMRDDFVRRLQTQAQDRLAFVSPDQLADLDVDQTLLTFFRSHDSQSAAKLRICCDVRAAQASEPRVQLFGYLLGMLVAAIDEKKIELDVTVKRTLLQNLAWLKGHNNDVDRLDELILYVFLAWQNNQSHIDTLQEQSVQVDLNAFAEQALWQPCKGVNYNRAYFDRYSDEALAQLHAHIVQAEQAWAQWCSQDAPLALAQWPTQAEPLLRKMQADLVRVFGYARDFSAELSSLLGDAALRSQRDAQIEIATMLLLLDGLILETHGAEESALESYFHEMARRLRCIRLGQPSGAYAPWMLAQQRKQTQLTASQVLVDVIREALLEAEVCLSAYWHSKAKVDLTRADAALSRILGVAFALEYKPFEAATVRLQQAIGRMLANTQSISKEKQHELTNELASLSLLLDMYAQGATEADAAISFKDVRLGMEPVIEQGLTVQSTPAPAPALPERVAMTDDELPLSTLFLEEWAELCVQGRSLLNKLLLLSIDATDVVDVVDVVDLRRSFHTMKGGARTVGLVHFAEVAAHIEQCLNAKIAEKSLPSHNVLETIALVFDRMNGWHAQMAASPTPEQVDARIDYGLPALQTALNEATLTPIAQHIAMPSNWLDLSTPALTSDSFASVSPSTQPQSDEEDAAVQEDPQRKVIGHLELSISLFNAYLNEADEWSRQLALALSEWEIEDHATLPSQTLTWAHALAGSSATVGFTDLAAIAKAVERLIERVQEQNWRPTGLARSLALAAEEMRQLLHQFAAGFLKTYDPQLLSNLNSYLAMPKTSEASPAVATSATAAVKLVPNEEATFAPSAEDAEIGAIFAEEAQELVLALSRVFRLWHEASSEDEQVKAALRILHTLKGSARLAHRHEMADIAHQLESDLEKLVLPASPANSHHFSQAVDQLESHLSGKADTPAVAITPAPAVHAAASAIVSTKPLAPLMAETATVAVTTTAAAAMPPPLAAGETIRVRSSIIDRLVNQAGEVMIARSRMEAETMRAAHTLVDLGAQAQRLRDQLRELELQTEMQMQSRQAKMTDQASPFDPLELDRFTRTQELTRFMAEAVSDITTLQRTLQQSLSATEDHLAAQRRQAIDMQRYLLSTRMVEFNSVSERLMRLVRVTSQELAKSVEITITNGALEMDRSVIERMLPAFEHLLRNAIVHGIEPESERLAKGKPAVGMISISLEQTGKDVQITVQDDGRGIDAKAVIAKAQSLYGDLPTQEPLQLIFASGLSTAQGVTELAGRGVGMDVVRAQVQALGGQIDVASEADIGTAFKLILPLTTAVTQIVLVRTANVITAVPVSLVITTLRLKPEIVQQSLRAGSLLYNDAQIAFYQFAPLIQLQAEAVEAHTVNVPVIVVQSAGQMIALQVDEVLGSQEAVVKNLGPQLSQLPGLTGMTVLPSGETVLIYNPVALVNVYGAQMASLATQDGIGLAEVRAPASEKTLAPLVLVVDDSITMRRVLQRLLQREGYRVQQAADGKQALDLLRVDKPALILSDVEMPRMDGFELLQQIRLSERLHDVPVVMITSRIADKHRDHALELGANAYLGKPYPEAELLDLIVRYAGKASA